MDKQKQIEETAKALGVAFQLSKTTRFVETAEYLVNAGYGNLKEFAERLKSKSNKQELVCSGALLRREYTFTDKIINELLEEYLG